MVLSIISGLFGIGMTDWPLPAFDASDWQLNSRERISDGFFQLDSLMLTHRGYQTEVLGPMHREICLRESAVVVILCDLARQEIVMVEQFRVGAAMSKLVDSPWMLEWVAGICDLDESPSATCCREVFEETGLVLTDAPEHLYTYYPSPGGSNELIHLFFSPCDATLVKRFRGQVKEYEDLKVHVISIASAFEALQTAKINNAATIIGLQWLKANNAKLFGGM